MRTKTTPKNTKGFKKVASGKLRAGDFIRLETGNLFPVKNPGLPLSSCTRYGWDVFRPRKGESRKAKSRRKAHRITATEIVSHAVQTLMPAVTVDVAVHNPENVPVEKLPVGYRFLTKEEFKNNTGDWKHGDSLIWLRETGWETQAGGFLGLSVATYCVRITPTVTPPAPVEAPKAAPDPFKGFKVGDRVEAKLGSRRTPQGTILALVDCKRGPQLVVNFDMPYEMRFESTGFEVDGYIAVGDAKFFTKEGA